MGNFLITFMNRHPWVTVFMILGAIDTVCELRKPKEEHKETEKA